MSLRACLRSPWFWILAAAAALRLAGLFWGLPASDGWDDDGFAPRNFLTALALTYKPGSYFTYPPLQAFLLAIPTLPGVIIALLHVQSWTQAGVVGEFTRSSTMTFFAITARLASVAMSLGIIACAGQMAEMIAGRRAGLFAAAACALGVTLTYYSQVTNLDVPYLFWGMLSLLWWMRGIARHEPGQFRWAILFAAAAIATKDQAYAIFLLSVPVLLLLWFAADAWPRAHCRRVVSTILLSALLAIALLLLLDGAITNPAGFARRLAFLTGPASRDYANYAQDVSGRVALLKDMASHFTQGLAAAALAAFGVALHVSGLRRNNAAGLAGLLPLLAAFSFTLCFNFVALRTDARFLLPQAILATVYIGIAADKIAFARPSWLGRAALAAVALFALYQCLAVDAAFLSDPRYDAEDWMAVHINPGDSVETYGQNAYLPRLPRNAVLSRVGPAALGIRNPLPGVTELRQPFGAIESRRPRFIIVSAWWVQRYLDLQQASGGRMPPPVLQRQYADADARGYFARLNEGGLHYRLVHQSAYAGRLFPAIHIHESLDEGIDIFERVADGPP